MSLIAKTPEPPYYAAIFTSIRRRGDLGYTRMADRMLQMAAQMPGFLGVEAAREALGITVSCKTLWFWLGVAIGLAGMGCFDLISAFNYCQYRIG